MAGQRNLAKADDTRLAQMREFTESLRVAGAELRERRLQQNMYQHNVVENTRTVAEDYPCMPLSTTEYSRIERGDLHEGPSIDQMALIGQVLGYSPEELFRIYNLPMDGGNPMPAELQRAWRVWRRLADGDLKDDFEALIRDATEKTLLKASRG